MGAAPWSVKGIDPKAREVAKDLARRSGMTLGEWLNRVILEDDMPEEVTSQAHFADRPQRPRLEALAPRPVLAPAPTIAAADGSGRVALALERLTDRIEASETRTGLAIAGVPDYTGAIGLLYRTRAWSVSLTDKQVGSTWALDNAAYKMDPYSSLDLNIGYTVEPKGFGFKTLKTTLGVFNLADHQDILSVSAKNNTVGTAAYGTVNAGDIFTYQPERSVMLSLRADF